jgi:fucose permease
MGKLYIYSMYQKEGQRLVPETIEEKLLNKDPVRAENQIKKSAVKTSLFLTAYLFSLMTLYAASVMLIGPIMPTVVSEYQIGLPQGGLIMTAQSVGGVLAILFTGMVADHVKKTRLVQLSYFIFGMALLLAGFVRSYSLLLLSFFIFGIGSRMSDTMINAYVSDVYAARRGYFLNLLHTFFGIGALAGPIYARYVLDSDMSWTRVFTLLGICALVLISVMPLVLRLTRNGTRKNPVQNTEVDLQPDATIMKLDRSIPRENNKSKARRRLAGHLTFIRTNPVTWLICLVMFLYVGHQSTLATWIPMYAETHLQTTSILSSLALSVMWLGIVLGRGLSAYLTEKFSAFIILIGGSLLGAVMMTAGILLQQPVILIIVLGLTGLFTGATIPLLVTVGCNRYPQYSGMVSSMIFLSGSVATMFFPWLAGHLTEIFSFQTAMMISWLTLYLVFAVGIWMRKWYHKV